MLAEREGFEPPIPVKVYTLSRRAPSATRPSLRAVNLNLFYQEAVSLFLLTPFHCLRCVCDLVHHSGRVRNLSLVVQGRTNIAVGVEPAFAGIGVRLSISRKRAAKSCHPAESIAPQAKFGTSLSRNSLNENGTSFVFALLSHPSKL